MRKKLLSLTLALVLCLGLFTVPASAAGAGVIEIVSPDTFGEFFIDIYGYDTRTGNMTSFTEGIASVGDQFAGYGAVDTTGRVVVPAHTIWSEIIYQNGVAWLLNKNMWTAIDSSGNELFTVDCKDIGASSVEAFSDGLARVYSNQTKLSGYLDMTGELVIPIEHSNTGDFHDGMAKVYDPANAFYGFIDKTGKLVIPCQYDYVEDFSHGFAKVRLGDTWSIIDKTGKALNLPEGYSPKTTVPVSPEVLRASTGSSYEERNTYVFFNKSGKIISGPYGPYSYESSEGMYRVRKENKYGYVNEAGVEVIPCTLDSVKEFRDGFAVGYSGTYGAYTFSIIDKTGKVTGTWTGKNPDSVVNIGNGCFRIYDGETSSTKRYGFIDYTGREIVPCKYKTLHEFECGVVPVRDFTDKTGFVNTLGEEVVPCKFSEIISRGDGVYQVKGYHDDDYRWSLIRGSGWTAPATSSTPSTPVQPSGITAAPTASKVLVNGKEVAFDAYTIDGSNYFKLRDLAFVLNGTKKQFEVGWDNASKTITLTSGSAYTANGSEMASGGGGSKSATVSASKLLIDGKEVSLTAYTIDGNNYFKLRDIGQAFDFGIGWDNASKTITIDTSTGYTE